MSQTQLQTESTRDRFLNTIRRAAEEFIAASPVALPPDQVRRHLDRFIGTFRQLAIKTPKLLECTPQSIARSMALCCITDLTAGEPHNDVWLIPRANYGKQELQWMMSWGGVVTLAGRAGIDLRTRAVFQGELFDWDEGSAEPRLIHKPSLEAKRDWDNLRCVYVVSRNGERVKFTVMPREEIEKRRAVSESWQRHVSEGKDSPWAKWPVEMALKSAVKYAANRKDILLDPVTAYALRQDEALPDVLDATPEPASASAPAPAPKLLAQNSYWIDDVPAEQEKAPVTGVAAVVAAAEKMSPGAAQASFVPTPNPGAAVASQASVPTAAPLEKPKRSRAKKPAAELPTLVERYGEQEQKRLDLLGSAKAAMGELSGAEREAVRDRLGIAEEADVGDLTDDQLRKVLAEVNAIVDERGAE